MSALVIASLGGSLLAAAPLRWTAPASCPSSAAVHERIAVLVGDDALGQDVEVDARVEAGAEGWVLELAVRTSEGSSRRSMASRDCETLAEAVALVLATFADPFQTTARLRREAVEMPRPPRPSSAPEVPDADATVLRTSTARSPAADGRRRRRPGPRGPGRWGLGLGIAAGRATQADLDLGPDLELSWQRGPLRLAVGALVLAPRTQPVEDRAGVALRTWVLAARVRAGIVMPLSSRLRLPISAALELGPVVARGQGIDSPRTVASPWLAAVVSARVVWRVTPRLLPWAGIDGVFGLAQPRFTVADSAPLALGPGGLRGLAGIQWLFSASRRQSRPSGTTSARAGH